jgi:GNAT superfamily N-acetyltransferase
VAFTTEENYQGRGIARLLLQHLVRIARENGVSRFEASVLAGNQPMVTVFRRSGLPIQQRSEDGVLYVTLLLPAEDSGGPSR